MLHIVLSYGFQVQIWWRQAGCRLLPDHLEACLLPDCTFGFTAPPLGYLMWKVLINTSLACKRSRSLSVSNIVILLALFWFCWGAGLRRLNLWLKLHPGSCFQAGRECQINWMNLCINSIRLIGKCPFDDTIQFPVVKALEKYINIYINWKTQITAIERP